MFSPDTANLRADLHTPFVVMTYHTLAPLPRPASTIVAQAPQPRLDPGKLR